MSSAHVSVILGTSWKYRQFPENQHPFRTSWGRGIMLGTRSHPYAVLGIFQREKIQSYWRRNQRSSCYCAVQGRLSGHRWNHLAHPHVLVVVGLDCRARPCASDKEETPKSRNTRLAQTPGLRVQMCTAVLLNVFRQVVFPFFSLHLLAPPFHAVSFCLEKLQKPVAIPVAHWPLNGLHGVFSDRVNPGIRGRQNRGVKIRVEVIVSCAGVVMVSWALNADSGGAGVPGELSGGWARAWIVLYRLQRVFQVIVEVQVSLHCCRHTVGSGEPAEAWRNRERRFSSRIFLKATSLSTFLCECDNRESHLLSLQR